MRALTKKNRRRITGRMGQHHFTQRLRKEEIRERNFNSRIHICPMRMIKSALTRVFKLTGLWRRGYREFINPIVRHNTFAIEGLDPRLEGLTILHLSDLHLDLDTELTSVIINLLHPLTYDLAVITGDFSDFTIHVDGTALYEMERIMPAFSAPVYGVLGNHDSVYDIPKLEAMGIRMLVNDSVTITHNGTACVLAGIDDPNIFQTHNLPKALPKRQHPETPVILLSHSPCIHKEAADHDVDIVLSGHTHGGQICLPNGGIILGKIDRGVKHVRKGYWREGGTQGWTSSGTGSCGIPFRLNCPPEVILHRLTTASTETHRDECP